MNEMLKNPWREVLLKSCKELGIKPKDVTVLGINRDPFLVGNGPQLQMAKWFKNVIDTYFPGVIQLHLRRVHYHISQKVKVRDIDGKGYNPIDTEGSDWEYRAGAFPLATVSPLNSCSPSEDTADSTGPRPFGKHAYIYMRGIPMQLHVSGSVRPRCAKSSIWRCRPDCVGHLDRHGMLYLISKTR